MMRWRSSAGAEEAADSAAELEADNSSNIKTAASSAAADMETNTASSSCAEPASPPAENGSQQQQIDEWSKQTPLSDNELEDDEGSDHAQEEQDDQDDPPIPWKPQTAQSTCEFTHTIQDYAKKRESGCKKAEYSNTTVDEFGNRWRLIVYVNGNGRASNHHLSLFLQVADAEDLPFGWKKAVSYVLTLEHPNGTSFDYAKRNPDKTFKLCPKAIDWGWSQFITSDRIQQEGYIATEQDSLTVRASVTVKSSSVIIDEEDSELYLKCAVEDGNEQAVKICLEHGASVNCKFKDDLYTPLHTACSSSTLGLSVLTLLLQEGADGNACNKWKETPLLIAANNGHGTAVAELIKHGANPSLCSEAGWSALTFAAHKGYDDIVSLLLHAGAPVNCPVTEDSSTPLHKACAGSKPGHLAAVKLLLEGGADVHALNKWRETPLLTAANHGQSGAVDALLRAGADPCKCTDTGWSPLSIAAYKGHDEVVRLLLEEGAPTEEDDPTLSALLQAATKGLPDTVELLLRHGADHTVTTKKGDTALSILVEQNLIDAAVEMVSEYNASIPRCSRDRKKVQRARLLITLRMKQMEREGKSTGDSSTDEEDTIEEDESNSRAQHLQHDTNANTNPSALSANSKKQKKKKSKKVSAEEKARAAEEALLLELEREESKAENKKASANSKRKKKKERKAKEREVKLKEEQARRDKEEQESRERDRVRKELEEEKRKQRELRQRQQEERERKEIQKHKKMLAAKRKEREEQERKRGQRTEATSSESLKNEVSLNGQQGKAVDTSQRETNGVPVRTSKTTAGSNRRWETATKTTSKSPPRTDTRETASNSPSETKLPQIPSGSSASKSRPVWAGESPSFPNPASVEHSKQSQETVSHPSLSESSTRPASSVQIEHPAIALFRREKVTELLSDCAQIIAISDDAFLRRILYRWLTRAAHDAAPVLDPIIPSWTDGEKLAAFFQRQLIAEGRRTGILRSSMEALKEAGSQMALFCHRLATEVETYREQIEKHLPKDWSDSALGMTATDGLLNGNGAVVTVSWVNRGQVFIPASTFMILRERHIGPPTRLLAACFMAKTWYDTRSLILEGTTLDFRLSPRTKNCLSSVASVTAELWTGPFQIGNGNDFWGMLEGVDVLFSGHKPFSKDVGREEFITRHGGSLSVFLPMDANVASNYVQRMTDILLRTESNSVPLSFVVFAHADCFHDLLNGPSESDLSHLDTRLNSECQSFVRCVELLPAGRHIFHCGDGSGAPKACHTTTLFVVLQNDAGKDRFDASPSAVARIIESVSLPAKIDNPIVTPFGLQNNYPGTDLPPLSSQNPFFEGLPPITPDTQRSVRSDIGAIGGSGFPHPFSPASETASRGTRTSGRFFDLVDNGEEDDVDLVSGMLNNLDVGLFQNNNVGSDVDIEAISLMGIGGPPMQPGTRSQRGSSFG